MNNSPQISTTININPAKDTAELVFQHIDKYIIGDILTLNEITEGKNQAYTYCSVPQTQAIFAFADLMGYLFRPNEFDDLNQQYETLTNLEYFFTKLNVGLSISLFDSDYHIYFPLTKKIYRDGLTHQYFPKTTYFGITKSLSEFDHLFVHNSFNVKRLTFDVLKAYKLIKEYCININFLNNIGLSLRG